MPRQMRRGRLPKTLNCSANRYVTLEKMQLSEIFKGLGQPAFEQLIRGISIGKLKTFQLYERVKLRFRMTKLNGESLRKAAPRLWSRIVEGDEEFATDVAQTVLVSHLEMIKDVLDFVGIPHEDGFFAKDLDATDKFTEGWQQRVFDEYRGRHPEAVLVFYINHLGHELAKEQTIYQPVAAPVA